MSDRDRVKAPEEMLGFRVGTDKRLADWPEIVDYFEGVGRASDRVRVETLGETTEGNPFILATVSSPENLENLERLRRVQMRLCDPADLKEGEEDRLLSEGKTIVLISCSIHSTEVGGSQMSMELLHWLASGDGPEVRQILDNVVLLLVPSLNPDGNRIVVEWYERYLGTEYEGTRPPYLYHKYSGHDNNRDWFMFNLAETRMAVEQVHNRWHPQIVYDIHQMGSKGPRFFLPPYIDPIDPNVDPVIVSGINFMGTSMADALAVEGKRGVAVNWVFDGWTPARAYQHYHGGIRILSEAASVDIASPIEVRPEELESERGLDVKEARWNQPLPWKGGRWTLRDIIDYELTAAKACLGNAARYRERWLRGSLEIGRRALNPDGGPYAFLIPPGQKDPGAVRELLEVLLMGDVRVQRATEPFKADGVDYPTGTYVVLYAQPYGRFAKTMLEKQEYPDLREKPTDPPKVPYDVTAHTLGLQMGIEVVQVQEPFEAEVEPVKEIATPAGEVYEAGKKFYIFTPEPNVSSRATNVLLDKGFRVHRTNAWAWVEFEEFKPGAFVVESGAGVLEALKQLAGETGLSFYGVDSPPEGASELHRPRIGIYKAWAQNADEGWLRMVLEQFGFHFETLTPQDVRQGSLSERLDVLIIPDLSRDVILKGMEAQRGLEASRYEPKYREGIGDKGTSEILKFLGEGGTVIALNRAADYPVKDLWVPAENALEGLKEEEFYIPGSILRVLVDNAHPIGYGFDREAAVMFLNSPAFSAKEGRIVAKYPEADPLLSGWILGEEHLHGLAAVADVPAGRGRVILMGFPPHFRNQARGTFKMLFNSVFYGAGEF